MMRWLSGIALVAGCLPAMAAGEKVPDLKQFEIVLTRNVFDASRRPYREEVKAPPVVHHDPPAPKREARIIALAGVFLADDRAVALFVMDGACENVAVGAEVAGMAVQAIDSGGVRIKAGDKELAVAVGERLSDGAGDEWTVVGRSPQAPSAQQVVDERKTADKAEILRQMMERRKRELQP